MRKYYAHGTNGSLFLNSNLQCHTIELPWLNNQHEVSCIPEGIYNLHSRFTERLGHHLLIADVPGRDLILIHSANNAIHELKGCIATVTKLTGEGRGDNSKQALALLLDVIRKGGNKTIFLNIKKQII